MLAQQPDARWAHLLACFHPRHRRRDAEWTASLLEEHAVPGRNTPIRRAPHPRQARLDPLATGEDRGDVLGMSRATWTRGFMP
jgi:hypothetical protein